MNPRLKALQRDAARIRHRIEEALPRPVDPSIQQRKAETYAYMFERAVNEFERGTHSQLDLAWLEREGKSIIREGLVCRAVEYRSMSEDQWGISPDGVAFDAIAYFLAFPRQETRASVLSAMRQWAVLDLLAYQEFRVKGTDWSGLRWEMISAKVAANLVLSEEVQLRENLNDQLRDVPVTATIPEQRLPGRTGADKPGQLEIPPRPAEIDDRPLASRTEPPLVRPPEPQPSADDQAARPSATSSSSERPEAQFPPNGVSAPASIGPNRWTSSPENWNFDPSRRCWVGVEEA